MHPEWYYAPQTQVKSEQRRMLIWVWESGFQSSVKLHFALCLSANSVTYNQESFQNVNVKEEVN